MRYCNGVEAQSLLRSARLATHSNRLSKLRCFQMTDVFEGSIIRCFRRLQELLRQMGQAAHAIGNTELKEKFSTSLKMLERQNTVVFNPS